MYEQIENYDSKMHYFSGFKATSLLLMQSKNLTVKIKHFQL